MSREAVIDTVNNTIAKYIQTFIGPYEKISLELARAIKNVPPVTPTHGTCKDCKHFYLEQSGDNFIPPLYRCVKYGMAFKGKTDFYCADFEK